MRPRRARPRCSSPTKLVEHVDAVVLTGGSAFGLATADGVMTFLAARGRGFRSSAGPVPIVPTAAIFDLVVSGGVHPTRGRRRRRARPPRRPATRSSTRPGRRGHRRDGRASGAARTHGVPGGLGSASVRVGDATVGALAVVNAIGDVIGDDGAVIAGSTRRPDVGGFPDPPLGPGENTTLVVVAHRRAVLEGRVPAAGPERARRPGPVAAPGRDPLRRRHRVRARDRELSTAHFDRLRLGVVEVVAAAVRAAVA